MVASRPHRVQALARRSRERCGAPRTEISLPTIAADNSVAAERRVGKLIAKADAAARLPMAGRVVPEKGRPDIREVFLRTYRIVYRVRERSILVLKLCPKGIACSLPTRPTLLTSEQPSARAKRARVRRGDLTRHVPPLLTMPAYAETPRARQAAKQLKGSA